MSGQRVHLGLSRWTVVVVVALLLVSVQGCGTSGGGSSSGNAATASQDDTAAAIAWTQKHAKDANTVQVAVTSVQGGLSLIEKDPTAGAAEALSVNLG